MRLKSLLRSVLYALWGFWDMHNKSTAGWLTVIFSTLIFATAHLNNLGSYPTSFILFQVGFSTIVSLAFGYTHLKQTAFILPSFCTRSSI